MRPVSMLPNLLTLANAGCGLLAISKAIDALTGEPEQFDGLLEAGCWLIFLAMVFDALDGRVARLTRSFSDFGAELDSLADAVTFGVAPAILAKALLEHEGFLHPRLHFLVAASFSLLALLRLARFNLENDHDEDSHSTFSGLPSPAAAGTLIATLLMYLSLSGTIEVAGGRPTFVGKGIGFLPQDVRDALLAGLLPAIVMLLPFLGLLMVSRVRYAHLASALIRRLDRRSGLVGVVFVALLFYAAPVPMLFVFGLAYVFLGLWSQRRRRVRPEHRQAA